jgi:fatty acid desaturase
VPSSDEDADRYETPAWLSRGVRWTAKLVFWVVVTFGTAFAVLTLAVAAVDVVAPDRDTATAAVVGVFLAVLLLGIGGLTLAWKPRRKRGNRS